MESEKSYPAIYRNSQYKSDTDHAIGASKTLMTPIGIWPLHRGDTLLDDIQRIVHLTVISVLIVIFLVPQLIYTFWDCEHLTRYMKVVASQTFSVLGIIKFLTTAVNRQKLRYCLTEIEVQYRDVECEEDRLVMTKSAKFGRFFISLYLGMSYGGGVPYHIILPLISEKIVKSDNTTQIPLPYRSNYILFKADDSPVYEIMFATQLFISSIILTINCGTYSLIATLAMHSCCLFEVVSRKLENLMKHNKDELHGKLSNIIRHHTKAIEFTENIEKAMSIVFFTEMVGCTLIICFIEFGLIMDWEQPNRNTFNTITYVVLTISIFLNVFIISFIGDRLKQKSEEVGRTAYFVQWYDLPIDLMKNTKMMILRANRSSNFTAAKLFDLSLQGFCEVCKTSAAYLNFLRAVTS